MNWTSEYPTEPGFYWIRNSQRDLTREPVIVEVDNDLNVHFNDCQFLLPRAFALNAEWQGPIEPQKEKLTPSKFHYSLELACRDCEETKKSFVSWELGKVDGKPFFGIICRECWIKRLTPE